MSNLKTRKQKQQSEQRRRKSQIKELQDLREKAIQLEKQIAEQKAENFKQLNIRNLKIFGNTCNFVAPFVITAGLTVGGFKMIGGGLPFHTDEITKYKLYNLDYQTNGYVTMEESYNKKHLLTNDLQSNELTIYTPWKYENNQYTRYKREYDIGKLDSLELFNAVLEENYSYIEENLKDYKEEIQTTNRIAIKEALDTNGPVLIEVMIGKDDKVFPMVAPGGAISKAFDETDLKNIIVTIIELILELGISGTIAHYRKYNYLWKLERTNQDYNYRIKAIKPMQEELALTNEKILSLSRIKEGKISDK